MFRRIAVFVVATMAWSAAAHAAVVVEVEASKDDDGLVSMQLKGQATIGRKPTQVKATFDTKPFKGKMNKEIVFKQTNGGIDFVIKVTPLEKGVKYSVDAKHGADATGKGGLIPYRKKE
jgi:hypothetical protein